MDRQAAVRQTGTDRQVDRQTRTARQTQTDRQKDRYKAERRKDRKVETDNVTDRNIA